MKRTTIISALVGLIFVLGLAAFLLPNNETPLSSENATGSQATAEVAEPETITNDSLTESNPVAGSYVDYDEGAIAGTSGEKVLFFHAPWCPQCRQIEQDIKDQGVPAGVTIIKVDYDSNQDLRQQYGVTLQTTFVKVDDEGNELEKYVAYNEPTFDAVKENLL